MNLFPRKHQIISYLVLIILAFLLCGCSTEYSLQFADANESVQYTDCRLRIITICDENAGYTTITQEEMGNNFSESITVNGFREVNWVSDDGVFPLDEAVSKGLITIEELVAYARIDARNGKCDEEYSSENGLSTFIYHYNNFDMKVVYDVYETPDKKQHLINSIGFYTNAQSVSSYYVDDDTGIALDREDWGLTFEVISASPAGITLNCTQSGGQQIGELVTSYFVLYKEGGSDPVKIVDGVEYVNLIDSEFSIKKDAVSQIKLDWTDTYGLQTSGDYTLRIAIQDDFDQEDVHPLMKDFYTQQQYLIQFTIPQN